MIVGGDRGHCRRYAREHMKAITAIIGCLVLSIVAFRIGRTNRSENEAIPSIPIAFVQATYPIAITIEVTLDGEEKNSLDGGISQLQGIAEYTFTNISGQPVKIQFPPNRTFAISRNQFSVDSVPCPMALSENEVITIPADRSIKRSGPWSAAVSGDASTFLKSGAGWLGFTFASSGEGNCISGTMIPFQSFKNYDVESKWHTTAGHIELVTSLTERQDGITKR